MKEKLLKRRFMENVAVNDKRKPKANTLYDKLLVLAKLMTVVRLLASDFPSKNPRTQTRNFPYTQTLNKLSKIR